jgi:hypothetical protein
MVEVESRIIEFRGGSKICLTCPKKDLSTLRARYGLRDQTLFINYNNIG